jgi:putative aminopeptidase FrvX
VPWFRCFVEGENFPGRLIGKRKPVGFFTTRYVEASDPADAETKVVEVLRQDPKLAIKIGVNPTDAIVFVTEIEKVKSPGKPNAGFTWYPMKS